MVGTIKPVRWTGPFTDGEIPLPFTVKFDPVDLNLSTLTNLTATLLDDDGTEMTFAGSVTWVTPGTGLAAVQLGAADLAVPVGKLVITRRLQVWAGDGSTTKIATVEIKYNCHPAIGTPPAV